MCEERIRCVFFFVGFIVLEKCMEMDDRYEIGSVHRGLTTSDRFVS